MRMHVPLATLAQLLPAGALADLTPAALGERLGMAPATVTAVETSPPGATTRGDQVVLHLEGVDPGLADAEGWVTAEWSIDTKGRARFGGFKPVTGEIAGTHVSVDELRQALAATSASDDTGSGSGDDPPAPPELPAGRRRGGSA
jgi:hypothetical protein